MFPAACLDIIPARNRINGKLRHPVFHGLGKTPFRFRLFLHRNIFLLPAGLFLTFAPFQILPSPFFPFFAFGLLLKLTGRFRRLPRLLFLRFLISLLGRQPFLFLLLPDFPFPFYSLFLRSFPGLLLLQFTFGGQFLGRFSFCQVILVKIISGSVSVSEKTDEPTKAAEPAPAATLKTSPRRNLWKRYGKKRECSCNRDWERIFPISALQAFLVNTILPLPGAP